MRNAPILALTAILAFSLVAADLAYARGGGGGMRGGGGGGMRGGGGGGFGGGRSGGNFGGGGFGGQRGAATNIQRPSGGFGGGNNVARNGNFNGNFNGNRNINANTNINRNINTNVDRNWNGGRYGYGGYGYHPVARGAAWGAAAAVTAAAVGSWAYSLPSGCSPWGGYYSCGGTWYQPQYSGSDVTYVVVNDPSNGAVANNTDYPANPPPPSPN